MKKQNSNPMKKHFNKENIGVTILAIIVVVILAVYLFLILSEATR